MLQMPQWGAPVVVYAYLKSGMKVILACSGF